MNIIINYDEIDLEALHIPDRPFTWPDGGVTGTDGTHYGDELADRAHLVTDEELTTIAATGRPFDYEV